MVAIVSFGGIIEQTVDPIHGFWGLFILIVYVFAGGIFLDKYIERK